VQLHLSSFYKSLSYI